MLDEIIIVARVSFSKKSLAEAVQAYILIKDLPVDIEKIGPFFKTESSQVLAITLYKFSKGEVGECLELVRKRYRSFAGVAGFSVDIGRWTSFESAIGRYLN